MTFSLRTPEKNSRTSYLWPTKLGRPCRDLRLTRPRWAGTFYDANSRYPKPSIERFPMSGVRSMLSLCSANDKIVELDQGLNMTEPGCILLPILVDHFHH
jgi:hypothetical protein